MTTQTLTLADFLLARVADDEDDAQFCHDMDCDLPFHGRVDPGFGWTCTCGVPEKVKAECEAKRRIVDLARDAAEAVADIREAFRDDDGERARVERAGYGQTDHAMQAVLRALALPYADHPDYRPEWRP